MATEIKYKNAIVRIHGNTDREKLKESTITYLKKSKRCRNGKSKETT